MIAQETIDRIKREASLLDVIGDTVNLQRRGSNFVGLCPFHSEKTPSFAIRESGESYRCFGCGVSGNVFSYVMETRGLSFPEAVEDLAARFGIEVKYEGKRFVKSAPSHAEDLYKMNILAQEFFSTSLGSAPRVVKDYVASRGLSTDSIEAFGVGYAPEAWTPLTELLREKGFSEELLVKSGLVRRSSKGRIYDAFRGRLIFPILLDSKRILGFGGRCIPEMIEESNAKSIPKYINSPETEVYKKSKTLFGLPQASVAIRESGEVYLVEGYLDVIGLWQVGVANSLATCGTAVTEDHVKRLSKLAKRVVILFDGDSAGRAAAAKMFRVALNAGIDVVAKFLEEGDDPDSLASMHGENTAQALQKFNSIPLFECFIDDILDGFRVDGQLGTVAKGQVAIKINQVLEQINNPIEKSLMAETAAARLGVAERELSSLASKAPVVEIVVEEELDSRLPFVELDSFQKEILYSVMAKRELAKELLGNGKICAFLHPTTLQFIEGLVEVLQEPSQGGSPHIEQKEATKALLHDFGPSWTLAWKKAYEMLGDEQVDMYGHFGACCQALIKQDDLREIRRLHGQQGLIDDPEEQARIAQQIVTLTRQVKNTGC